MRKGNYRLLLVYIIMYFFVAFFLQSHLTTVNRDFSIYAIILALIIIAFMIGIGVVALRVIVNDSDMSFTEEKPILDKNGFPKYSRKGRIWVYSNLTFAWIVCLFMIIDITYYVVILDFFYDEEILNLLADYFYLAIFPTVLYIPYVLMETGTIDTVEEKTYFSFSCSHCHHDAKIYYSDFPNYFGYPSTQKGNPMIKCPVCGLPFELEGFKNYYKWHRKYKNFVQWNEI